MHIFHQPKREKYKNCNRFVINELTMFEHLRERILIFDLSIWLFLFTSIRLMMSLNGIVFVFSNFFVTYSTDCDPNCVMRTAKSHRNSWCLNFSPLFFPLKRTSLLRYGIWIWNFTSSFNFIISVRLCVPDCVPRNRKHSNLIESIFTFDKWCHPIGETNGRRRENVFLLFFPFVEMHDWEMSFPRFCFLRNCNRYWRASYNRSIG